MTHPLFSCDKVKGLILKDAGYYVFLTLFLSYMCVGIFPLYCYESDSMHTIMGMATLYNQGFTIPPIYGYEYDMQPLAYYLVAGVRHVLPFLTCEQLYCALTGLAALVFVPLSVHVIHRLTSLHKNVILLAMFLIPETMAIGMYPNTAILALVPVMFGLLCLLNRKHILAAILLAVAPMFRVDVLMIYPVVLFFFMYRGDSFVAGLKKSALLGLCVTAIIVAGFAIMQANPLATSLETREYWNDKIPTMRIFMSILSFYDVINFILVPVGVYVAVKKKQYRLLLLAVVPMLLNHFVYRSMACAAKHFLYMLPFMAILSSVAICKIIEVTKSRRVVRSVIVGALIVFLIGSTRIYYKGRPWRNDVATAEAQCGPVFRLFTESVTPLRVTFGIGAGETISTFDEYMLFTGNAFYPLYIRDLKENGLRRRKQAADYMGNKSCHLVSTSWESKANLPLYYMDRGFSFETDGKVITLKKGEEIIAFQFVGKNEFPNTLRGREEVMEESIVSARQLGKSCLMYHSVGSDIYVANRQVEKGNIEKVEGTESLYLITPDE